MDRRLFHFSEGTSNKFWSIETTGTKTVVHFGKTGTAGQAQEKEWASEAAALAAAAKLIAEKTKKGYTEQSGSAAAVAAAPPAPAPVVKAPAKPKSKTQAPKTQEANTADPAAAAPPKPDHQDSPVTVSSENPPPSFQAPVLNPDGTLHLERHIDLAEQDWWWAVWRPRRTLPLPEIRPFDRAACLAKLNQIAANKYFRDWRWHLLNLPPRLSMEEAWFWRKAVLMWRNVALTEGRDPLKIILSELATATPKPGFDPDPERGWRFHGAGQDVCELSLLGIEGMLARHGVFSSDIRVSHPEFAKPFRSLVLPYLTPSETEVLRTRLRPLLSPSAPPASHYAQYLPDAVIPAAALNMPEPLAQIVSAIPTEYYKGGNSFYQRPQELVFGLGSAEEVRSEMRRISAPLLFQEHITAWLACTEFSDLDLIADAIVNQSNRDEAAKLMHPLLGVHAVDVVPVMFRLMLESKASAQARQWLTDHPAHAIAGAVSLAAGRGKTAEAAMEFLTESAARGQRPLIEAALKGLPPEQSALVAENALAEAAARLPVFDERNTPMWLREGLPSVKGVPARTPGNVSFESLPQVAVGPWALNREQMVQLIHLLSTASIENPPAILAQIKQQATAASLDALVWKFFTTWMTDGAPSKQKWVLLSLGFLGSDAIALKLAPLIRKWPGESQHQRAVTGLQVLRMIGTDTALMQLNGIAQKLPFKGLKERARELMNEIAKTRGLTKAELEDRIVPDCGLDERGARLFNFGPRQFELLLGSDLKPVIRETSGKKRPDLPAPNSTDDPALAAEAVADWKLLKKNLREVLKIQTERLEQSMITGRRWTAEEFRTLFVNHPLMTHLSRWIIWACYDSDGSVSGTLRVNDDRTLTDASDDAFSLPADAVIGIVHPLQLDETVKNAWGEIHGDYEIIAPFPQLGRPLFALLPDEKSTDTIRRGKGHQIAAASLVGVFEKSGWVRDSPADAGGYAAHSKPFTAAHLTAFAHYDPGLWIGGSMAEMEDQEITEVYFVPGLRGPDWWSSHKDRIPLDKVDPIVLTEVLRDVETILAKAK